jgi:hypothetical protein
VFSGPAESVGVELDRVDEVSGDAVPVMADEVVRKPERKVADSAVVADCFLDVCLKQVVRRDTQVDDAVSHQDVVDPVVKDLVTELLNKVRSLVFVSRLNDVYENPLLIPFVYDRCRFLFVVDGLVVTVLHSVKNTSRCVRRCRPSLRNTAHVLVIVDKCSIYSIGTIKLGSACMDGVRKDGECLLRLIFRRYVFVSCMYKMSSVDLVVSQTRFVCSFGIRVDERSVVDVRLGLVLFVR